jgi:uncharacterized membrane protein YcaP (DUF421 family)
MDKFVKVEWDELFIPTHSIAEMVVRGALMYLALFIILRFVMKRQAGALGIADIWVIVVIADAAQNGFSKEYRSVTEGITLVVTIVLLDYFIDWAGYYVPALRRLVEPPPLNLIRNGRMLHRNMRQEFITIDELKSQLRKQGVDDVRKVKSAHMEPDGEISVIKIGDNGEKHRAVRRKPGSN